MSKVVHLSDLAHNKAKAFCQVRGLKMSEWVASLIDHAVEQLPHEPPRTQAAMPQASSEPEPVRQPSPEPMPEQAAHASYHALVPKKKTLAHAPAAIKMADEGLPVYEAPPFWATNSKQA